MRYSNILKLSSAAIALSVGVQASAQDAADTETIDDETIFEEIVVTTTRRETKLMTTAGSITAIGGEALESGGVLNATDFDNIVPNMRIADQSAQGMGAIQISMRGIVNSSFIEIGDPNVGFHVDGVYMSRPQAAVNLMHDAQRMEIARGPQGTLFGRNSTVGSINVVNNRPDSTEFSGRVNLEYGKYDNRIGSAVVNVPIVEDKLALRASGFIQKRDTYFDLRDDDVLQLLGGLTLDDSPYRQAFGAGTGEDGAGAIDQHAYRVSALFTPTDNLSAYVTYEKFDNESAPAPQTVRAEPYTAYLSNPNWMDQSIETVRAELKYNIGDVVELKGTFGDQNYFHEMMVDLDSGTSRFSPIRANPQAGDALTFEQTFYDRAWQTDSRSYEVVASSTYESDVQWLVGYFNFEEDTFRNFWIDLPTNGSGIINFNQPSRLAKTEAFFGRVDWDINDKWHVAVGARRTKDQRTDTGVNRFSAFPGDGSINKYGTPVFLDQQGISDLAFLCSANPALGPCNGVDTTGGNTAVGLAGGIPVPGLGDGFAAAPGSPIADVQAGIAAATCPECTIFDTPITTEEQLRDISALLSAGEEVALINGAGQFPRVFYTDQQFKYTDWSLTVDYTPRDGTFLYATVSTGHKAGSQEIFYHPRLNQFINSIIRPEKLTSYEIGWKEEFEDFGDGLNLSSTFFFMDYKDKQQSTFVDGGDLFCADTFGDFNGDGLLESFLPFVGGIPIFAVSSANTANADVQSDGQFALTQAQVAAAVANCSQGSTGDGGALADQPGMPNFVELMQINMGNAQVAGFEFEYDWRIDSNDRISGYATVNVKNAFSDADPSALPFDLNDSLACGDRVGGCPNVGTLNGNELPFAPDVTLRVDYEHFFEMDSGATITTHAGLVYNSSYWLSVWNVDCYDSIRLGTEVCDNGDKQDAFATLDLRLRYDSPNQNYYVELYGQNVTGTTYATNAMRPTNEDYVTPYAFNTPAMWGVRAGFSW